LTTDPDAGASSEEEDLLALLSVAPTESNRDLTASAESVRHDA
jgi:hypothetical protein